MPGQAESYQDQAEVLGQVGGKSPGPGHLAWPWLPGQAQQPGRLDQLPGHSYTGTRPLLTGHQGLSTGHPGLLDQAPGHSYPGTRPLFTGHQGLPSGHPGRPGPGCCIETSQAGLGPGSGPWALGPLGLYYVCQSHTSENLMICDSSQYLDSVH